LESMSHLNEKNLLGHFGLDIIRSAQAPVKRYPDPTTTGCKPSCDEIGLCVDTSHSTVASYPGARVMTPSSSSPVAAPKPNTALVSVNPHPMRGGSCGAESNAAQRAGGNPAIAMRPTACVLSARLRTRPGDQARPSPPAAGDEEEGGEGTSVRGGREPPSALPIVLSRRSDQSVGPARRCPARHRRPGRDRPHRRALARPCRAVREFVGRVGRAGPERNRSDEPGRAGRAGPGRTGRAGMG
jgi:hypothetical protein